MGSSIGVLHEALKIAHTYTFFDEKFLWIRDSFLHYDFGIFLVFYMRIMQSENFATNIHAHYRQSETAPYTRIIREKNFAPDIYEKLRCVRNPCAIDWVLISLRSFVSCFYICGRRLNKTVFIDWSMPKFGYKSVIKSHKLIVKM